MSPPFSLSCTGPVCISGVFVVLTLFLRKSTEHLYFQRQTNSSMERFLRGTTASIELFYYGAAPRNITASMELFYYGAAS